LVDGGREFWVVNCVNNEGCKGFRGARNDPSRVEVGGFGVLKCDGVGCKLVGGVLGKEGIEGVNEGGKRENVVINWSAFDDNFVRGLRWGGGMKGSKFTFVDLRRGKLMRVLRGRGGDIHGGFFPGFRIPPTLSCRGLRGIC